MTPRLIAAATACLPLMLAASAHAQSVFDIPDEEAETYIDLGAAVVSRAAYVGSEEDDLNIFPYAAGEYQGRLWLNPAIGAGVNVINNGVVTLSPFVGFASGRDADDTPFVFDPEDLDAGEVPGVAGGVTPVALTDLTDDAFELDSSVTAGGLFNVLLPFARLDVAAVTPVTGDIEGIRSDISLTTRLPVGPFFFAPGVRATWMSDAWVESYYGFTTDQVGLLQALDFSDADIAAGLNPDDAWTLGAHAIVTWELVDDVQVIGALNYSDLQGDAADSPFSPDDTALTAVLGVAKRF